MRRAIIFLLLLAEAQTSLGEPRSLEKKQEKSEKVLIRSKRTWVLSTFELDEEIDGPFPQFFTELHNDQHLNTSHKFRISGQGVLEEPKNVFDLREKTGEIYIQKAIDRELYPILKVQFDVLDDQNNLLDKTLAFNVIIKDKNDNAPLFTPNVLNVKVPENIKEGLLPFSLQASDKDELDNDNSRISLSIVSQDPPLPKVYIESFSAVQNSITAKFAFTGCFDFDKIKTYKILVEARDHGTPQQSSTATVFLAITDSNTHAPVLTANKHNAQVMEMETNKEILRIPVKDQDTPNTPGSNAVFTILKGNEDGNYKIETDPVTNEGVLSVIKGKDYERTTLAELEIGVKNEEPLFVCNNWKPVSPLPKDVKVGGTAKVAVKIVDVNDPPVFKNKIQKVFKAEEEDPGEVLYTPIITDEDSDPSKIKYELVEDPANWMSMDPKTGSISLVKKMDRESPYVRNSTYTVVMRAIDDGEPPATGTGTLVISLSDKNDNTPRLVSNTLVMCGNKVDRVKVTAEDADVFPFSGPFAFTFGKEDQELMSQWKLDTNIKSETFLICRKPLPFLNYTVPLKIVDLQGGVGYDDLHVVLCDCGEGDGCLLSPRTSRLQAAAIVIILGAIMLMIVLLCLIFACEKNKKRFKGYEDYENTQSLMKFNEEGQGSFDKDFYIKWKQQVKPKHPVKSSQPDDAVYPKYSMKDTVKPATYFHPNRNIYLNNLKTDAVTDTKVTYGYEDKVDSCYFYRTNKAWSRNGMNWKSGTSWSGLSSTLHNLITEQVHNLEKKEQQDFLEFPKDYSCEGSDPSTRDIDSLDLCCFDEDLDFLDDLGPKFNTLGKICQQTIQEKKIILN